MSQSRGLGGDAPDVKELDDEDHWTFLAKKHWPELVKSRKVKPLVIKKDIWDRLENENFEFRSLVTLENLQVLEKYVSTKSSYHYHY